MIYFLIAIVCLAVVSVALIKYSLDGRDFDELAAFFGIIFAIVTATFAVAYCVVGYNWLAAGAKTTILNREYGTSYTQQEVFYAADVINAIREVQRTRIELNGNLLQDKD